MFVPLVILILSTYEQELSGSLLRIMGGRNANYSEFPYVVRLEMYVAPKTYWHSCTGTVITSTWTLTAGHCRTAHYKRLVVRYGSERPLDHNARIARILKFVIHTSYRLNSVLEFSSGPRLFMENDVMLLKTQPIIIHSYGRLSALDYTSLFGQVAMACGYGKVLRNGTTVLDTLQTNKPLQFFTVLMRRCTHEDFSSSRLYPGICLSKKCGDRHLNTAPGDSGAPLLHKSGVVAVHSLGAFSLHPNRNLRSKMTVIGPYLEWIGGIIKESNVTVS